MEGVATADEGTPGFPADEYSASRVTDLDQAAERAIALGIRRVNALAFRDVDDAAAGGSEVHADRVFSRWAAAGIEVRLRTVTAPGLPADPGRDRYDVHRRGGRRAGVPRITLEAAARRLPEADAVVEVWNGLPFWTPLWWRGARLVLLHHLHDELWKAFFPAPFDRVGSVIERRIAPWCYRSTPVATLAPSSRHELLARTPLRAEHVHVVPPGIDDWYRTAGVGDADSPTPLVVAAGRLTSAKRFDVLIRAVHALRVELPEVRLVIVGEGPERPVLERLVAELGVGSAVELTGWATRDELLDWYRRAWVVASASVSEGWGMTLTEAAAVGTPAVATDIVGHRDAVAAGAGLLVDDQVGFETALRKVLTDGELRAELGSAALGARRLSWDATAARLLGLLVDDAQRR